MMQVEIDRESLWLLIDGCSRHKAFRGGKDPTYECESCRRIRRTRELMLASYSPARDNPPSDRYVGTVDPLCWYCTQALPHTRSEHMRSSTEQLRGTH